MEELLRRPDEDPEPEGEPLEAAPLQPNQELDHSLTGHEPRDAPERELEPLSEYEELEVVGTGGTGVVTLARHRESGQQVAIKRLRREAELLAQRFLREAETIASLEHPAIVRLLQVVPNAAGGPLALVLELVEGPDLERLIQREGQLPLAQTLEIGLGLAEALDHAHQRGVVHRDVKPSNVLLDRAGRPKLVDFGLALPIETQVSLTQSGAPCGTVDYMAPEQWAGRGVDARADQYGLGATLYRMLTGSSARVIREGRIPDLVRGLVLRCVEEDPAERYPDMAHVARALRRALVLALEDSSGVFAPLERIAKQLGRDLEQARRRSDSQRLRVASAGLEALGLLPDDGPGRLSARLEVGQPLEDVLRRLVDTVLRQARRRPQRPALLADAHAVLSAALARADLDSETAHEALRRLSEASREPVRNDAGQRLTRAVANLAARGALSPGDVRWLANSPGNLQAVLEGILSRLRTRSLDATTGPAEERAQVARWRHALQDLRSALPELTERIEQELLAVQLRGIATAHEGEEADVA